MKGRDFEEERVEGRWKGGGREMEGGWKGVKEK